MSADPTTAGATGAGAIAPGANGGVAGTVAGLAQPPAAPSTAFGARDQTAGFSPYAGVLAGSYANDPSMANFGAGINLGRTATLGPGQDYTTLTAQHAPREISSGNNLFIDPTKGNVPGNVVSGGSTYVHAGDEASGTADVGLANTDLETGNAAKASLGKIDPIIDLYKTAVAPGTDFGGKVWGDVVNKAAAAAGVDPAKYSEPAAAKALIKTQLLSFVGGLKDAAGNPMPRNSLDLIVSQIPDPTADPQGFLASMNWVRAHLQAQASNADAAQRFLETRTTDPNAGTSFHAQRGANAGAEGAAYTASGLKGVEGGQGGGGAGSGGKLPPADPTTVQRLKVKWQQAGGTPQARAAIIAAARENGVDAEAGGF